MSADTAGRSAAARAASLLSWAAGSIVGLGLVASAIALLGAEGGERFGHAYILGLTFLWTVVLGSLFLVGLHHVSNAVWSVVVRRVAEMLARPMWLVAVLFVPILPLAVFTDVFSIFPWVHPEHDIHGPMPASQVLYLSPVFFTARQAVYFGAWLLFAAYFVGASLRQDRGDAADAIGSKARRVAAPFMVVFGFTMTFAAFDWLMSQEPHWHSTIFGVYIFAGMAGTALAVMTLLVLYFRARGVFEEGLVRDDHLYNLGGLMFAFSCFWGYIAFSQFMLIWYGDIADETPFFHRRFAGEWLTLSMLLPVLRFFLPFGLLLSRDSKSDPRRLVLAAAIVIAGELAEIYWLIYPQHLPGDVRIGIQEFGPLLCMTGALLFTVVRFLRTHKAVAEGDPRFEASKHFHL